VTLDDLTAAAISLFTCSSSPSAAAIFWSIGLGIVRGGGGPWEGRSEDLNCLDGAVPVDDDEGPAERVEFSEVDEGSGLEGLNSGAAADILVNFGRGEEEGLEARRLGGSDDSTDMVTWGRRGVVE
jgi:hypothetical protein